MQIFILNINKKINLLLNIKDNISIYCLIDIIIILY